MLLAHFVYRAHSEIQYSNYLNKKSRNETKMVSGSEHLRKTIQLIRRPMKAYYVHTIETLVSVPMTLNEN